MKLASHTYSIFLMDIFPSLHPYLRSASWTFQPAFGVVGVTTIIPGYVAKRCMRCCINRCRSRCACRKSTAGVVLPMLSKTLFGAVREESWEWGTPVAISARIV